MEKYEFKEAHIQKVLMELQMRFGFPAKNWKVRFGNYPTKNGVDVVGKFMYFGNEIINPLLNEILCRRSGYPTFNNLCDYVTGKRK
jgi:hypothetical protein